MFALVLCQLYPQLIAFDICICWRLAKIVVGATRVQAPGGHRTQPVRRICPRPMPGLHTYGQPPFPCPSIRSSVPVANIIWISAGMCFLGFEWKTLYSWPGLLTSISCYAGIGEVNLTRAALLCSHAILSPRTNQFLYRHPYIMQHCDP